MATYATTTDLETYIEDYVDPGATAAERLLERAEEDIDRLAVTVPYPNPDALRRFEPATLTERQRHWLMRATVAQAEYRMGMGSSFFVEAEYPIAAGPDFSHEGHLPKIGPKVWGWLREVAPLTTSIGSARVSEREWFERG